MENQDTSTIFSSSAKRKMLLISAGTSTFAAVLFGWLTRPYMFGYKLELAQYLVFLPSLFANDSDGKVARAMTSHLSVYAIGGLVAGIAFAVLINTIRDKK